MNHGCWINAANFHGTFPTASFSNCHHDWHSPQFRLGSVFVKKVRASLLSIPLAEGEQVRLQGHGYADPSRLWLLLLLSHRIAREYAVGNCHPTP